MKTWTLWIKYYLLGYCWESQDWLSTNLWYRDAQGLGTWVDNYDLGKDWNHIYNRMETNLPNWSRR